LYFFPLAKAADKSQPEVTIMAKTDALRAETAQLDPTVRALGVVSLLNDFSSEVAVRALAAFPAIDLRRISPCSRNDM